MKIQIESVPCHKVNVENGGVYLRCLADIAKGPTPIWYAATAGGWELIPDATYDALEAVFKQDQMKGAH